MALIDEITLHLSAGRGGDGVVRWRHEKGKEYAGAGGGNGGMGGSVFAKAIRDIAVLKRYRQVKELKAERGAAGENFGRQGKTGANLTIEVPIGSVLKNLSTGEIFELLQDGQVTKILEGGRGGLGNEYFKSSTNVTPKESTEGRAGENADFLIELRLIADAGLIGLPNAGKTSLLNALTAAAAKVGDYPFTTLEPNLGVLYGFVLADVPGLIEGASTGKGLGVKFLRHVSRTKLLIHCVSVDDPEPMTSYTTIRKELAGYSDELVDKEELIVLTKMDLADEKKILSLKKTFEKLKKKVFVVSILDDKSLKSFSDKLIRVLR